MNGERTGKHDRWVWQTFGVDVGGGRASKLIAAGRRLRTKLVAGSHLVAAGLGRAGHAAGREVRAAGADFAHGVSGAATTAAAGVKGAYNANSSPEMLDSLWHGVTGATGQVADGTLKAVRHAGSAAGQAYDRTADGAAGGVSAVAGERSGARFRRVARALAQPVREHARFGLSAVQASGEVLGETAKSTGDLVLLPAHLTDGKYRAKAGKTFIEVETALGGAERNAARHPRQAAAAIGRAASGAAAELKHNYAEAERHGTVPEFAGHMTGHGLTALATSGLPLSKLGKLGKGATVVGKLTEGAGTARALTAGEGAARAEASTARVFPRPRSKMPARPANDFAAEMKNVGPKSGGGQAAPAVTAAPAPAVTAAPADPLDAHPWIRTINGAGGTAPRDPTRVQSAYNVARRFATGQSTRVPLASPHVPAETGKLEDVGHTFGAGFREMGLGQAFSYIGAHGEGAHAVVVGLPAAGGDTYAVNALVHNGSAEFLDGHVGDDAWTTLSQYPAVGVAMMGKVGDGVFRPEMIAKQAAAADARAAKMQGSVTGLGRAARYAEAKAMIETCGTATKADEKLILRVVAKHVPASTSKALREKKVPVRLVVTHDSITQRFPWAASSPSAAAAASYNPTVREVVYPTVLSREGLKKGISARTPPRGRTPRRKKLSINPTLHEIGHAIDGNLYGGTPASPLSSRPDWSAAFKKDRWKIGRINIGGNLQEEMWAEYYARFLVDPVRTKKRTPNLYAYFQKLMQTPAAP